MKTLSFSFSDYAGMKFNDFINLVVSKLGYSSPPVKVDYMYVDLAVNLCEELSKQETPDNYWIPLDCGELAPNTVRVYPRLLHAKARDKVCKGCRGFKPHVIHTYQCDRRFCRLKNHCYFVATNWSREDYYVER